MELGVQCESNLRRADMEEFILVVFRTSKFANNFTQRIVLAGTQSRKVVYDKAVNGKDIRKLDIKGGFCAGEKIVECIDLELGFCLSDVDH
jgi:hypothetical protein